MKRVGEIWEWKTQNRSLLFLVVSEETLVLHMFELETGKKIWLTSREVHEKTLIDGTSWKRLA